MTPIYCCLRRLYSMLRTTNTFIPAGGPAELFADLWEQNEPLIPWEWGGRSFLLSRAPEVSLATLRSPALQRTWQLELALGPGVLASPGQAWSEGRGTAKGLFADELVPKFCDAALHSLSEREGALSAPEELDLFPELSRIALGAFTQYAFGSLPNDEEWRKLQGIQELLIQQIGSLNFPGKTNVSEFMRVKEAGESCTSEIDEVITGMLERCLEMQGSAPDFVRHLEASEESGSLTHSTAKSQMRNVLTASFLTTGILLTNVVREAILSDGLWEALREEALGAPQLASPRSAADLGRPLATASVDEAARLFPPVWFVGREATEDVKLNGHQIPEGTIVHVVLLGHQRDPELWEDPLRWNPERFLNTSKGSVSAANIPFLTGRHVCLGQSFAHAEASLLLSEIARRFEVRPVSSSDPIQLKDGIVLAPDQPVLARVEER